MIQVILRLCCFPGEEGGVHACAPHYQPCPLRGVIRPHMRGGPWGGSAGRPPRRRREFSLFALLVRGPHKGLWDEDLGDSGMCPGTGSWVGVEGTPESLLTAGKGGCSPWPPSPPWPLEHASPALPVRFGAAPAGIPEGLIRRCSD